MTLGATGSNFRAYWGAETLEGTAPGGNWDQFPCFALDIDATPGLQSDSLLSSNARRNAADPFQSVARVEGRAVVPIDTVVFGWWLHLLMGDANTTGAGPNYTHTFKSGATTLPTRSIEKAFPDIGRFEVASGVYANTMEVSISPDGAAQATIGLLCRSSVNAGSTAAGTPVVPAYTRMHLTQGAITYGGTALPGVTSGTIRFSNGLQPVPTVGSALGVGGIDLGEVTGGGNISVRFASHAMEANARALTNAPLVFTLTLNANTSVAFSYPRTSLQPTSAAVEGAGAVTRSYNFVASDDASDASLLTVTYRNQVAAYT